MAFSLPSNLFAANRLVEDAELVYRLTEKFRTTLLQGNDAPLPTHLPDLDMPPLQAIQPLARCLSGIQGHFVRLDDADTLLQAMIKHIIQRAELSPDGCVAAILLSPYNQYTAHHSVNCGLLASRMANALALAEEEKRTLVGAALTMNLGSIDVQDQMASQNGPPSTLQRQILNVHPFISSAMLREAKIEDPLWHNIVLMHHERKDGQGYPFGATDAEIPPLAQLLHLIDVVTAQLLPRTYRGHITPKAALATLYTGTRETFDPTYTAQLVKILGIYPPGSFVELENGERALVVKNGKTATTPLAVPIRAPNESIDTSLPGYHVKMGVKMHLEERYLSLLSQYWR